MEDDNGAVFEEGNNFNIMWKDVLTGILKENVESKSQIEALRAEHDQLREDHDALEVTSTRENSLRKNLFMSLEEKQHKENTARVTDITKLDGKLDTDTGVRKTEIAALDSSAKGENDSRMTEIANMKNLAESENDARKTDIANLDNIVKSEDDGRKAEIAALNKRADDDTAARSGEDRALNDRLDMEIDDRETSNCDLQNRMDSQNDERKADTDGIRTRMMKENEFLRSLNGKTLGVYFNAYRTKAYDGGGEENLPFQGTYCNTGEALNCKTGIFTCPCGGTYMFQFHIATHDNKKAMLSIRKNGEEIATIFDQNHQDNHKNSMAGQNVIVDVKRGDEIAVYAYTGTWLADFPTLHYTHWVGLLIKPSEEEMINMRKIAEEGPAPIEHGVQNCTVL